MRRHEEIARDLRDAINRGDYRPGDTIPHEPELMERYGASRHAVRTAVAALTRDGLVVPVRRRGTVVRDRAGRRRVRRGRMVRRDERGYVMPAAAREGEPWQVHGRPRRAVVPIPARPAELLGLEEGTEVLRRRRVTSPAGEPPYQIADTWIHPTAVADAPQVAEPHTGPGGYLDRLEEAGHGPIAWTEYTRVRMPEPDEARHLGMPDSMPVMEIARVGSSARTGAPVEVTICVIPADRVELVADLRRAPSARWPRD
ncbi:GntR family transcriptional regulator [Thermobifida cellulosilytica]|nr:GntR family transcriptional regulator [Thermobifida cellulosilytica]